MARLLSIGFELNSTANFTEISSNTGTGKSIQSTTKRSGTYAMQVSSLSSGAASGFRVEWSASTGNGPYYTRFYFKG